MNVLSSLLLERMRRGARVVIEGFRVSFESDRVLRRVTAVSQSRAVS